MKKIFTLLLIAGNIISANAQDITSGFYHVRNATTGRCLVMTDNSKGATDTKTFSSIDFGSVETNRNAEYVGTHPGAVCYISPIGGDKYDVAAQGTSISKLTGGIIYPTIEKKDNGYTIRGIYKNGSIYISIMLGDKLEQDRTTGELKDEGRLVQVTTYDRAIWELIPIKEPFTTNNFIGIKPEVQTADGTWWASFFAGFAFDLHSTGMKAFYVNSANDKEFTLKEITGTIPANTPVLIQCATSDYTQNIIKPKTSNAEPIKVLMDGVYFDRTAANHFNATAYDKNKMRVLGVDENKKLVFHVAPASYLTEGKYLPHNKAYLFVTSSTADTLYEKGGTGINEIQINAEVETAKEGTFNLKGQRVNEEITTPGVYIQNGKKVIIK